MSTLHGINLWERLRLRRKRVEEEVSFETRIEDPMRHVNSSPG